MNIGEGFAGDGTNAAHINVVVGERDGPVGIAWATALASPSAGHTPFVVVAKANLPVKPMTLLVNKASIASDKHGRLTWGAAQAGVAAGVIAALRDGVADPAHVCIAAVWVNPDADDEEAVFTNNRDATRLALGAAQDGRPSVEEVLSMGEPENPYFRA